MRDKEKTLSNQSVGSQQRINEATQTAWIYFTVQQFTKRHPAFTQGGLRSLIFNKHSNGLAESGAIVKIGRKLLISEEKFFIWVEAQNGGKND